MDSKWDRLDGDLKNKRSIRRGDGKLFEGQVFLLLGNMKGGNNAWINVIKENGGGVTFVYSDKVRESLHYIPEYLSPTQVTIVVCGAGISTRERALIKQAKAAVKEEFLASSRQNYVLAQVELHSVKSKKGV